VKKIAFIGAGKMAESLIARLSGYSIYAADVDSKRLAYLKKKYKINVAKDNQAAFGAADIVVLSVKPQQMSKVLADLVVTNKPLIISIAAGIPVAYLQKKLKGLTVIRAMPNNPCLVGQGITALAQGKRVKAAEAIFKAVGEVIIVPEKWLNAVTGLSGSGPAFVYNIIESFIVGGVLAGLPKKTAAKLALHTIIGAVGTMVETQKEPQELIEMVASPGGTTVEGLKVLRKRNFSRALVEAVLAAAKKSQLLSQQWTL